MGIILCIADLIFHVLLPMSILYELICRLYRLKMHVCVKVRRREPPSLDQQGAELTASLELEAVEEGEEGEDEDDDEEEEEEGEEGGAEEELEERLLWDTGGSTTTSSDRLLLHLSSCWGSTSSVTSFPAEKQKQRHAISPSLRKTAAVDVHFLPTAQPQDALPLKAGSVWVWAPQCLVIQSLYSATSWVTRIILPNILSEERSQRLR